MRQRRCGPASEDEKQRRLDEDRGLLDALGQTKTWEYAEHMGVSEQIAKNRLKRLYDHGLAERFRKRDEIGWTYVRIVRAGESVTG